ncbi:hypothetical protein BaRGS_00006851 [Batillaria attramentaria]|uniref:Uncharacterized protein n=1 Tax=Batillaria attramentaria TaxID=370345 RepID=A0ABD0LQX5_9CAEN
MYPSKDAKDSSSGCPADMFPCYMDCCQRGEQFCNHNPREQRCQHCSTRKIYCRNYSHLPVECDAYCLKQEIATWQKAPPSGDVAYVWSTCILAALVALLLAYEGVSCCRRKTRQRQRQAAETTTENEGASPSDHLLSDSDPIQSRKPNGHAADLGSICAEPSAFQLSPLDRRPSQPTPIDETVQPEPTSPHSIVQCDPLTPSPSPSSTPAVTPACDTHQTKMKMPISSASIKEASLPSLEKLAQQQLSHTSSDISFDAFRCGPSDNSCSKMACRDSRLDNIIPSSDSGHIVSIHTGTRGPLNGEVRYMADN